MLVLYADGIGSARVGLDGGQSILRKTVDYLAAELEGARAVRVEWPASMAGVGGRMPWDAAAHLGVLTLDKLLMENPHEDVILLGYSGGCKVIHDFTASRPEQHYRIKAVGYLSDPFRPRDKMQHGRPDPGGWGICGQDAGPATLADRTFWSAWGEDVITACPADSPLRTLADLSERIPGGFLDDFAGHIRLNNWQLANHIRMWKRDPLGYLRDLPGRMRLARRGVEGYLSGQHTSAYTRKVDGHGWSYAEHLGATIAWSLRG